MAQHGYSEEEEVDIKEEIWDIANNRPMSHSILDDPFALEDYCKEVQSESGENSQRKNRHWNTRIITTIVTAALEGGAFGKVAQESLRIIFHKLLEKEMKW